MRWWHKDDSIGSQNDLKINYSAGLAYVSHIHIFPLAFRRHNCIPLFPSASPTYVSLVFPLWLHQQQCHALHDLCISVFLAARTRHARTCKRTWSEPEAAEQPTPRPKNCDKAYWCEWSRAFGPIRSASGWRGWTCWPNLNRQLIEPPIALLFGAFAVVTSETSNRKLSAC